MPGCPWTSIGVHEHLCLGIHRRPWASTGAMSIREQRWSSMGIREQLLASVGIRGHSWASMGTHGHRWLPLAFVGIRGQSWPALGIYAWSSMGIRGHIWVSMDIHTHPRAFMGVHGHVDNHRCPWASVGIVGPWASVGIHGRPLASMVVHGCSWVSVGTPTDCLSYVYTALQSYLKFCHPGTLRKIPKTGVKTPNAFHFLEDSHCRRNWSSSTSSLPAHAVCRVCLAFSPPWDA